MKGQGGGGGVSGQRPKKKVTAPILMVEVVIRNFGFASDSVRGPNGSFGNQTDRMSNSSKTTGAKRHGSKTTRV